MPPLAGDATIRPANALLRADAESIVGERRGWGDGNLAAGRERSSGVQRSS